MVRKLSSKDAEKLRRRLEAERKRLSWNHRPPNTELDPYILEEDDEPYELRSEEEE